MFLHLRWFGIDEKPYYVKAVNITLSRRNYDYVREISHAYEIPYSDLFKEAIIHNKRRHYREYLRHLRRSGREDAEKVLVAENIDETLQKGYEDQTFRWPTETFYDKSQGKRIRMCLRMGIWDIRLLRRISTPKRLVGDFLVILVRRMKGHVISKRRHKKMTFGVRMEDYEMLIRFMGRYVQKYNETLTRSEVVVFAYHLFKHMKGFEQRRILKQESLEGKKRGKFRKFSVSFLWPFYTSTKSLKLGPSRRSLYIDDGKHLNPIPYYEDEQKNEDRYFKAVVDEALEEEDWKRSKGLREEDCINPGFEIPSRSEGYDLTCHREPRIAELRTALYYFLRQETTRELIR